LGFPISVAGRIGETSSVFLVLAVLMGFVAAITAVNPRPNPVSQFVAAAWRRVEPMLPASLRHEINRPGGWADALDRGLEELRRVLNAGPFVVGDGRYPGQAQGGEQRPATRSEAEKAAYAKLHTERFLPEWELSDLGAAEIRRRISGRDMEEDRRLKGVMEKRELLNILSELGGSSAKMCTICVDDYAKGEEVRVLPRCRHVFHRGCVDEWFKHCPHRPDCPLCKEPMLNL